MQTVTARRSKLLPLRHAQSFAKCLAARGQSADVQVRESGRTRSQERRWFVHWTPKSVEAHRRILAHSQAQRDERAKQGVYQFRLSDCGRFHWCRSGQSGKTYETTHAACTCPDYLYRLRFTGLRCRHSVALELWLEAESERVAEDEAAERHAEYARRMNEDWGPCD